MSTRTENTPDESPAGVTPPSAPGGREGFLSDVVVELGFATRETVEQAVRAARSPGTTVAGVLVDMEAISEGQLAQAIAERYGIDYIDLEGFAVDPAAANLIKPTAAKRYQAVPVGFVGQGLLVAMADPADALGVNDIAVMTKLDVRPAVAARPALGALLEALPLDEGAYDHCAALAAGAEGGTRQAPTEEAETAVEPASLAVFWQDGSGDELPEGLDGSPADAGHASQLRNDLTALKRQLAGAEARLSGKTAGSASASNADVTELQARLAEAGAELDEARVRVREAKEVSAELETLREALTAAEKGLDEASELARAGQAVSAEADGLRARLAELEEAQASDRSTAKDANRLRERMDSVRSERDEARERAREAETELRRIRADVDVRSGEIDALREKLTDAETELVRERAEIDTRSSELEASRTRAQSAQADAQGALKRADAAESERERSALAERDLREQLNEEQAHRALLEQRLAQVDGSAVAAERALQELRVAQGRMRGALEALADPGAPEDD